MTERKDEQRGSNSLDSDRTEIYRTLQARLPKDDHAHLQSVLARNGAALLDRGVPYLLTAVRNERISSWRRSAREVVSEGPEQIAILDPAAVVAQRDELGAAMDAIRSIEERDGWLLWWTAEGFSLAEIAGMWDEAGFDPKKPSPEYLRVRRSRARQRLRELLLEAGYGRPEGATRR